MALQGSEARVQMPASCNKGEDNNALAARQGRPAASVVIPTYRRPDCVLTALESVIAQQPDFPFEVLVLDNGCEKALEAQVRAVAMRTAIGVHYIAVTRIGLHNGRHTGALNAKAEIVVFIDDDIVADQGWLQAIVDAFEDPSVCVAGGPILPLYRGDQPAWLEAFWRHSKGNKKWCGPLTLMDYGEQECNIDPRLIWGANFAIRKARLIALGGFHPDGFPWELRRYRGDGETALSRAVRGQGLRGVYQPRAVVYHAIPADRLTPEYFERRYFLQGISDSFTEIRRSALVAGSRIGAVCLALQSVYLHLRELRLRTERSLSCLLARNAHHSVRDAVSQAYLAGHRYHLDEVRSDPELLKWVLQADYLNTQRSPSWPRRPTRRADRGT